LVAAPFGGAGENLLAVVRTPHIGGVLEFYRLNGNKFEIVTETHDFSTHTIGSRNLFTVQACDFDKDGQVELLAPDQGQTRLGIVNMDGAVTWLELNAELVTNLASVTSPNSDNLVLAAGLSNNTLRLWLP
jgi:kynureninase